MCVRERRLLEVDLVLHLQSDLHLFIGNIRLNNVTTACVSERGGLAEGLRGGLGVTRREAVVLPALPGAGSV